MKNDMPETIWLSEYDTCVSFDSEEDCRMIGHTHRPYKYTLTDTLIARIEAMKREEFVIGGCLQQRQFDQEYNAALSAVIDMLGQKEGA